MLLMQAAKWHWQPETTSSVFDNIAMTNGQELCLFKHFKYVMYVQVQRTMPIRPASILSISDAETILIENSQRIAMHSNGPRDNSLVSKQRQLHILHILHLHVSSFLLDKGAA